MLASLAKVGDNGSYNVGKFRVFVLSLNAEYNAGVATQFRRREIMYDPGMFGKYTSASGVKRLNQRLRWLLPLVMVLLVVSLVSPILSSSAQSAQTNWVRGCPQSWRDERLRRGDAHKFV